MLCAQQVARESVNLIGYIVSRVYRNSGCVLWVFLAIMHHVECSEERFYFPYY